MSGSARWRGHALTLGPLARLGERRYACAVRIEGVAAGYAVRAHSFFHPVRWFLLGPAGVLECHDEALDSGLEGRRKPEVLAALRRAFSRLGETERDRLRDRARAWDGNVRCG